MGGADQRRLVLVRLEPGDHADPKARRCALPARGAGARGEGGDGDTIIDHRGLARVDAAAPDDPVPDVAAAADEGGGHGAAEPDLGAELVQGGAAHGRIVADMGGHPADAAEPGAVSHEGVPAERHGEQGVGAMAARQAEQLQREAPVARIAALAHLQADPLDAEGVELRRQVVRARPQQRDHRPDAVPLPDPAQLQNQPRRPFGGEGAEDDQWAPARHQ